jgi:GH15 family glucan-1,4-alpha-glucosidase
MMTITATKNSISAEKYPALERLGVIGDRRTAALVADDGTLNWLCLPCYADDVIFGSLLDAEKGGFFRFGVAHPSQASQSYIKESAVLVTRWETDAFTVELTDFMPDPQDERPEDLGSQRVIIRRLRCLKGKTQGVLQLEPRFGFVQSAESELVENGATFQVGKHALTLWTETPLRKTPAGVLADFELAKGDEIWAILCYKPVAQKWSAKQANKLLESTLDYWHKWAQSIIYVGPRDEKVRQAACFVHLLSYAPEGSLVAAPTSSLPERIGGNRNYDYRFAWVRDASLALANLSLLGETHAAWRYMEWLSNVCSSTDAPIQVVYGIRGDLELTQIERTDIAGYRDSQPVRFGNHAYSQRQLDSLGYLIECLLTYHEQGCEWDEKYWDIVKQAADYTAANWQKPDSGIWELPEQAHYVSSKVMSWVALDRAIKIAEKTGHAGQTDEWHKIADAIHAEVMEKGWCEITGAFRQRYDRNELDASVLLIPLFGFLPGDHPRVLATIEKVVEKLTIEGWVHRFEPSVLKGDATEKCSHLPVGEYEGAFVPCTLWLAVAYAKSRKVAEAEEILAKVESLMGDKGILPEEVDARTGAFLGNLPLVFSHAEYLRAVQEVAKAKPVEKTMLTVGHMERIVRHTVDKPIAALLNESGSMQSGRHSFGRRLVGGAISGALATLPMTGSMKLMFGLLPIQEKRQLPPGQAITNLNRALGLAQKAPPPDAREALITLNHYAFGALSGAVYAATADTILYKKLPSSVRGILFGLVVWSSSYIGWLPAFGFVPPVTKKPLGHNLLMIAAHVVWGYALGKFHERFSEK